MYAVGFAQVHIHTFCPVILLWSEKYSIISGPVSHDFSKKLFVVIFTKFAQSCIFSLDQQYYHIRYKEHRLFSSLAELKPKFNCHPMTNTKLGTLLTREDFPRRELVFHWDSSRGNVYITLHINIIIETITQSLCIGLAIHCQWSRIEQ